MFKKFSVEENVSAMSKVKSSAERGIKRAIVEQYPYAEDHIDDLIPKKGMVEGKCSNHVSMVIVDGESRFFSQRGGAWFPTLRVIHRYPKMMPAVQVDEGAIRFVMSGASIMCPGLTSAGGRMDVDLPADTPVVIMAEGKERALAIGILKMSTADIKEVNKGIGVEVLHYLGDGLWNEPVFA